MTLKIKKIFLYLSFIFILFFFLTNSSTIISSTIDASKLFFYKVFPSLLPFFILTDFLLNYGFQNLTNKTTFHIIILSILTGLPGNAKIIKDLLDSKDLTTKEATKILSYTFFPNAMFVIGTIGTILFNNIQIGIKILLLNYLTNFIIAFFLREKIVTNISKRNERKNINVLIKTSLTKAFESMTIILGSITIFTILSNLFSLYSPFNNTINSVISGIFEMTNGINKISLIDISLKTKIMLTSALLSFSGLSIISQASSILSSYNINFKFVLKIRTLSVFINIMLTYILF